MKYGIKDNIWESIISVFSKHKKIERVILYGSRAKGNYKNGSDIDLTLVGKDISIEDLNSIHLELDELYLPYSFDISVFDKLENKDLIEHINRVGIIIYER